MNIKIPIIVMLLLWGCFIDLTAQQERLNYNSISPNRFSIGISGLVYDNLSINNTGEDLLNSRFCFSSQVEFSYYRYIKNGFGINIGAGIGLAPFNLNYYFKAPEGSIFDTGDRYMDAIFYDYYTWMWVFPVSISKVFIIKKKTLLNTELGFKMNIQGNYPWDAEFEHSVYFSEDNPNVYVFTCNLSSTENTKYVASYFAKVGLILPNKRRNTYTLNFVINYSPVIISTGEYRFHNLTFESFGTLEQNLNYLGIEFIYGIGFPKRKGK